MENRNIAFIGGGNMARSLIGGLIANGMSKTRITAADPVSEQRQSLNNQFGIQVVSDNTEAIANSDVIVIAIKPQIMHQVIEAIAADVAKRGCLLISIAAGVRLTSIMNWLRSETAVIRVMPNTPSLIQAGAAALFANEHTSDSQKNTAEAMMRSVGTAVWLDNEDLMDAVTALSGSGPAYFFYVMEAMEAAAMELGLKEEQARLLTIETALGAAKMALLSNHDPAALRKQVTSPGGTTERALSVMEKGKLKSLITKAMSSARQRSIELSKEFGE